MVRRSRFITAAIARPDQPGAVNAPPRACHTATLTARAAASFAENEALLWSQSGTIQDTIQQAIALFHAEGPGGGHYQNLEGPYTQVGCGVYIATGNITLVQDFR